jgi:arsenate reductase
MMADKKRALFVCTGNRARSQMAEGLLRHIAGDRFEVHSAGTLPSGVAELTVEAMREIDIDITSQWSKHVDDFDGQAFDYVITVCDTAKESCPVFPGGEQLHWSIEDPSDIEARGVPLVEAFRIAREELRKRIETFAGES